MTTPTSVGVAAWIAAHAARLEPTTLAPATATDAARIDALVARIDSARVVILGELSHWVAEKTTFRLWWLRRLAARHTLVLAEELGHSDGLRVSRYLESGDATWLDRVPTFGWTADQRTDRDDRPTGVLRASFDRYPTSRFKAAQSGFYREVRALGLRRFHGLDVNAVGCAGYADIRDRLGHVESGLARRIAQQLAQVAGESVRDEAARLTALSAFLAPRRCQDATLEAIATDVEVMADTLRYQALAHPAPDYEALRPAMAWREDMMKRAVARVVDGLAGDEKLVLMAHALHLVKDDDRVGGAPGAGPGGGIVHTLGHYLARERGEQVFAIWFVYGRGSDGQPFPDLPNEYHYPADTLNARLLATGTPLVIPTAPGANGALKAPVGIGHLYNLIAPVDLAAQSDAVFFLPTVTPLPDA